MVQYLGQERLCALRARAVAGLSIGTGREAYQTVLGQALVALGLAVVVGCWLWAGRIMVVPEEERVFDA